MSFLKSIKEKGSYFQASKGSYVFHEGDLCENFLLVEEGCIKVFKTSEKGQELVLYRVDADNLCTLSTSCVMSGAHYPAHGLIEKDVKGVVLSKEVFDEFIISNLEFKELVFASLTNRFNSFVEKIDEIAFHSIKERLWAFLMSKLINSKVISITHQELANELGAERETVSRALKFFEKSGKLTIHRGSISINL